MGFLKEFKEFAVKGNVMDLAVGVIIGGAFGKIVDSVVKDLIMALADAQAVENAVVFAYGNFITVAINFLLLAFAVFLMVKGINRLKRKEEAAAPEPAAPAGPSQEELLAEIRDLLKKQQ